MIESPIRVLLWSPRGSGEQYNGPASFTYRLYSSAPPERVKVTLVHGWPQQKSYTLFHSQYCLTDYRKSPLHMARFIRRGYDWLDENVSQFDVLHGINAFHATVLPAAHAQKLHLPAVIFVSNHETQLGDKEGIKRLLGFARKRRRLVKEMAGLVAMSQAIYEELVSYGIPDEKIARIPMGVNTKLFFPLRSETDRRELRSQLGWLDLPTVIFVGAIVRRKRPDLLIEATGLLKRRGLECQLILVGPALDLSYTRKMKSRATELGISRQVVWHGFTQDPAQLFRAADFFSLPSTNEGMSAALIEAMASGLPPVVTAISGSIDAVEDGYTGRVIQPVAQELADALGEYILNPSSADMHRRAARERVVRCFSNESVYSAYERLFRRIMAGGYARE